ncbi:AMP nucleosidase [Fodinicurvata sediminis]|uniref:AMP nucleosidase n=1 Tax=Fodinicurvata sediminis TaxID=1121832 RepID=UPI00047BD4AF|nr:AMP nucleosidase [Fodinicurvata sediminis]
MPDVATPPAIPTESFTDAEAAANRIREIYERNTAFLRECFKAYLSGDTQLQASRATYPFVRVATTSHALVDSRYAYGFVSRPGIHETTVTRPDVFGNYLHEQIALLMENHEVEVQIGESDEPIPVHFAFKRDINLETGPLQQDPDAITQPLRDLFDVPNLAGMDDSIINGTLETDDNAPQPLALFRAGRIDYSLHRLLHYTGTSPTWFQNFVIFTNYQFYLDSFVRIGRERVERGDPGCLAFVEPGNVVTQRKEGGRVETTGQPPERMPQMPAYHLVGTNNSGITIINIGAGPSNARTMTDHVAVLRPHAWLMLGHCAGLRNTQKLGDYVLAHGYVREDHVLDEDLPTWVPVPALAEVQVALEKAVAEVTGLSDYDLKKVMRTGTVASVDNRNWELSEHKAVMRRLSQSRAIALDMESAAIAANGFRCRVPYGTLLCVSDKPLHGEIKLAGMAGEFYRQRVDQHLEIGLKALESLQSQERERLHSRKLRSITEVAFQ